MRKQTSSQSHTSSTAATLPRPSAPPAPSAQPSDTSPLLENSPPEWHATMQVRLIQVCLCLNVLLLGFERTSSAASAPSIGSDFHGSNKVQWVVNGYTIMSTAVQPYYGRLSDVYGRRHAFFISTVLFSIGQVFSFLCPSGHRHNLKYLVLSRMVAGIGGAGQMSMATIILNDIVPLRLRGLYQVSITLANGIGGIIGGGLGGYLAQNWTWRFVYLFQIPIALLTHILGYFFIPSNADLSLMRSQNYPCDDRPKPIQPAMDYKGSLCLFVSLVCLLLGISLGGSTLHWTSTSNIIFFSVSYLSFIGFLYIEDQYDITETKFQRAAPVGIHPLYLVKSVKSSAVLFTNFFSGFAVYTCLYLTPLFFQAVLWESVQLAGWRLVIPSASTILSSTLTGFLMHRFGLLATLVKFGAFVIGIGTVLMLLLCDKVINVPTQEGHGISHSFSYLSYLLPNHLGIGIIFPSSLFTMLAAWPQDHQAVVTCAVYLWRACGSIIGITISASTIDSYILTHLPQALADNGIAESDRKALVDIARHDLEHIRKLEHPIRRIISEIYRDGLARCFTICTIFACLGLFSSLFTRGDRLMRQAAVAARRR
ncbi:hypothetical protein CANCADRAFT_569 [Tortispora caseinolytica NRRL Y-17796]|uniref:Major facilitator superfamily (MFS) profile domain-containing protein n=1 Tax=Tortispora caseinolytica NRRL Y-17796 TaxID=767744 RepID=A0A1E4TJQ0_9ASCO|nr:hypothetical protein CANCADRAFT_569 [Tortispora caseinolytica NRRL Y-17796]